MNGILIVEDHAPTAGALQEYLEYEGYECHQAADGAEAMAFLRTRPVPALVLLDLGLPAVASGLEVLAWMEAQPHLSQVPTIVVTGAALDEPTRYALRGVACVLQKPVPLEQIEALIRRYCAVPA